MVGDAPYDESAVWNTSDRPSIDEIFDIVSESRRRCVLRILIDHGEELTLSRLAENVALRDDGPPRNDVPSTNDRGHSDVREERLRRIITTLHHVDVPKLCHVGVVEYDPNEKTIRATESAKQVEHILALARSPVEPDTGH